MIKRFFGKKVELPQQISLEFSELSGWIENESDQMFRKLRSHIQRMYGEIRDTLEDLDNSKVQLVNAEFGEKVFKRVAKAGASNRDNLVKNLNIIKDRTIVPEDTDPAKAFEFYTDTKALLTTSLENAIRSQQYVKAIFPEAYRDILANLKRFQGLLEELVAPINEERDKLEAYDRLHALIRQIQDTNSGIESRKAHIIDLENRCSSLRSDKKDAALTLKDLEESKASVHANELEARVSMLKSKIQSIDSQLSDLFAPLSKALSRMEKQDESGRHTLSSDSRKMLGLLKNKPAQALDEDINPFLAELKVMIEDGSLGLKQQNIKKTLDQIDKLAGPDLVWSMKEERMSYSLELEPLSSELEGLEVYREKSHIEKVVCDTQGMIDSTGQELETERRDLARLNNDIEKVKVQLNSDLNIVFRQDIEVKYQVE
ncbi:MAG: hypothetical protein SCH39_06970 [Methanosarcinales archaeon]|nr:hypothetical protein [Methanosarcinales archaeon]